MPGNAALNLAMKVRSDAKTGKCDKGDGERPGPPCQEKNENGQEKAREEDCQAHPRKAITALV